MSGRDRQPAVHPGVIAFGHKSEAEERRSVDKFNQTVSCLTSARLGL